jgi:leucine dehydrogenase
VKIVEGLGGDTASFDELLRRWDGEQVVIRYDQATAAWMFVCMHSSRLGPATGGTRMRVYPNASDALLDGLRLSAGMTRKLAVVGLPFGGGKAVIAVQAIPTGDRRRMLIERYADLVASLKGAFYTGEDMNITVADVDQIWTHAPYVFCRSAATGGSGDPSPSTALGVLQGIRASLEHLTGSDALRGRSVVVQGVGAVGSHLAELLAAEGADLTVGDVALDRARALADRLGARVVSADAVFEESCEVFAPCAVGGILNADTIPRLRCRIVAGSANNQLAEPEDAERLRARGVLYAPDYVINAGGILQGVGIEALHWPTTLLAERLAGIGQTLRQIFREAQTEGITTNDAAERLAHARLAGAEPRTAAVGSAGQRSR